VQRLRFVILLFFLIASVSEGQDAEPLLRIEHVWSDNMLVHQDCVAVMKNGDYTYEQSWHNGAPDSKNKPKAQVRSGVLSAPEQSELQSLLANPRLATLKTPPLPKEGAMLGSESHTVYIVRDQEVQSLIFDSASGGNRVASVRLPNAYLTKEMKPLLNWFNQIAKTPGNATATDSTNCQLRIFLDALHTRPTTP
jgi:hypothetical protein